VAAGAGGVRRAGRGGGRRAQPGRGERVWAELSRVAERDGRRQGRHGREQATWGRDRDRFLLLGTGCWRIALLGSLWICCA
jgi:hypothetical protein